jgi:hypothetical protein
MLAMRAKRLLSIFLGVLLWTGVYADPLNANKQETLTFRDAKLYLEAVEEATRLSLVEQQALWKNFLVQHPDSTFREEIEANMRQIKSLMGSELDSDKPKISDAEILFKAKEYIRAKNLSKTDQWLLWKQFLQDHPNNQFQDEVRGLMQELAYEIKRQKKKGVATP